MHLSFEIMEKEDSKRAAHHNGQSGPTSFPVPKYGLGKVSFRTFLYYIFPSNRGKDGTKEQSRAHSEEKQIDTHRSVLQKPCMVLSESLDNASVQFKNEA